RVKAFPGVETAGLTSRLPLESHGINENPLYPEGDSSYADKLPPIQLFTATSGDYFRAMSIPIVAGRPFDSMEIEREGNAIVSLRTARFFWKDPTGAAAVGRRFRPLPTGRLYTVVGVAGDTPDRALGTPPAPAVYFPETLAPDGAFATSKRTMAL